MYYLNHCAIVCAIGHSHAAIKHALLTEARSGLQLSEQYSLGHALPIGQVKLDLPSMAHWPLPFRSRNNQLLLACLQPIRAAIEQCISQYGRARVGIVLGTSTSGIANTELALRHYLEKGNLGPDFHYAQQEMSAPATMLAQELQLHGPAYVHSSACSSSAKAMASAARLLQMGVCDAVITGGVDSLCGFTVAGFSALESVSATTCNPLSANRNGINIGEGAALFLMTREAASVQLAGWGESSDGYHMSAPDPSGSGAQLSMQAALQRAKISAAEIDYINLHGTATAQNDAMEAQVIDRLFGPQVYVSSTKPFTGHALGAAAAIEAGLCWLAMQDDNPQGLLPPHLWDGVADAALPTLQLALPGSRLGRPLRHVLSNSFAFGGSNASLLFARTA